MSMETEKRREVLAQATLESVTAYQFTMRQKKKETLEAKAAEKAAADAAAAAEAAKSVGTPQEGQVKAGEDVPPGEAADAAAIPPLKVYEFE